MRRVTSCAILCLALMGCRTRDEYKVIERVNDSDDWVKIVLEHNGHKFHGTCNNYKGGLNGEIKHCDLHVGQTIRCKSFPNRDEEGYDLICGSELYKGRLTTTGGNELIQIDKEEQ